MIDRLIETVPDLDRLIRFISKQRLPFRATIVDGRPRSYDQNKLMWQWAKDAADQRPGMTVADVQNEWKLLFGVPILVTENVTFAEAWMGAENCTHEQKLNLMRITAVTSMMTVDQQKRFLNEIEQYNLENGIELTDPEERRHGPKIGRRVDRDAGSGDTDQRQEKDRGASGEPVRGLYAGLQREAETPVRPQTTTVRPKRGEP
jgi:hypothetical protein